VNDSTIVAVETYTSKTFRQLAHVRIETADGVTGLGETFHRAEAVAAFIHDSLAPALVGQDGRQHAKLRRLVQSRFDGGNIWAGTATVDSSAASAVDIALWDLRGKVFGLPVSELLGGVNRSPIPVYNTCAGPGEGMPMPGSPRTQLHLAEPWGLGGSFGQYDDYRAMFERPAELAEELLSEGIRAMKLYTFRPAARTTQGTYLSNAQLEEALTPFRLIREAVGMEMELMVDLLFDWTLAPAQRIVAGLEEYKLLWIEDPLRWGARRHHAVLQAQTTTPIAAFDYAVGLESYIDLVDKGGLSILRVDPQWVGGISEAARIAAYADSLGLGIVFHDCTGPINFTASTHLAVNAPTTIFQESVRGYWRAVYPSIVTVCPSFENGFVAPPPGPGLGTELNEDYLGLTDLRVVRSEVEGGDLVTKLVRAPS